jgi:aspartyl-tRNA(Asn)/glutamyl-tRNA(Gln) amidotransferase subunit C
MSIAREEVRRVAVLARLALSDAEEEAISEQLGHILDYFHRLSELNTDDVEPTAHVTSTATRRRDDVVQNEPSTERWLANAPARDGDFFKVPKIIE